jgi:hypothetical protein
LQKPSWWPSITPRSRSAYGIEDTTQSCPARHLLRESDAGVLRVGEAAMGDYLVALRTLGTEHGQFGGEAVLVGRALNQRDPAGCVAGGEDVGYAGL